MTPQAALTLLAPVSRAHEATLRALLDGMNTAPGRVDPHNALIPFARFDTLHNARLLILDDHTADDLRLHGVEPPRQPLYFALLADIDGSEEEFLDLLVIRAEAGLRTVFACCEGYEPDADLRAWLQRRRVRSSAAYVNTRGRTVRQVHEEAALKRALDAHLAAEAHAYKHLAPAAIHARLRGFVEGERAAGRLILSAPEPTPPAWYVANLTHLIAVPLLALALSPLLALAAVFYLPALRRHERSDPAPVMHATQAHSEALALAEDHLVTNQYSALGSRKPGLLRRLSIVGVLMVVDYAARHLARPGRLGRIRTIHFARWVLMDDTGRLAFFSSYDGNAESYMDDFINKAGFGLNVFASNGVGYPRTRWLLLDGAADELRFKDFQRRHTVPSQVWYKAYPDLTAVDLERNARIRAGLAAPVLDDAAATAWLALL